MPPEPVRIARQAKNGRVLLGPDRKPVEDVEPLGGVFVPLAKKRIRTALWKCGEGRSELAFYTCPVSAIPDDVYRLLELWYRCHTLGALPVAGGVLDQPLVVQHTFPIFAAEHAAVDRERQMTGQAMAVTGALARLFGRRG